MKILIFFLSPKANIRLSIHGAALGSVRQWSHVQSHPLQIAVINKMKFKVLHDQCRAHDSHRDVPRGGNGQDDEGDHRDLTRVDEVIFIDFPSLRLSQLARKAVTKLSERGEAPLCTLIRFSGINHWLNNRRQQSFICICLKSYAYKLWAYVKLPFSIILFISIILFPCLCTTDDGPNERGMARAVNEGVLHLSVAGIFDVFRGWCEEGAKAKVECDTPLL